LRWTGLVGAGLSLRLSRRRRRLADEAYWTNNSSALQIGQLRKNIERAARTEFGRAHDFASLSALPDSELVEAYRRSTPVADWYAFQEPLARMREGGERDVLWPGLVEDFCQTSGTTAGDKFIPVSREMMRSNYRAALDIFANLGLRGVSLTRLLSGKCLFLGGSTKLVANEHGVRTGDLSGLATQLIKWPLTEIYSPGAEIALMDNWPDKIDAMARHTLAQDIRMVNGMPSWSLVLMERVLELAREQGRDVETIAEVWPNLSVFVHGGVRYAPFSPRIREVLSGSPEGEDIAFRHEIYPASEGFVAMQDAHWDDEASGRSPPMRLNTDIDLFFEFVPLESIDEPDPPTMTCDQVEPGVRYVVVLTTCAGLWRYILGDVVEFSSAPRSASGAGWGGAGGGGAPPRLRIVGRHRHFVNAFGENLIVEHIENAVVKAAGEVGLPVGEFTAAPVYPSESKRAGLELAIEIEGTPGADGLERFRMAFDEAIKSQNVDYTTKRTADMGMAPPTITPLPPGAFHRWLEARGKLGGQHKCPRCSNTREILEGVTEAVGGSP
jgi:hypothetical protein